MLTIILIAVMLFLVFSATEGLAAGCGAAVGGAVIGLFAAFIIGIPIYSGDKEWRSDTPVPLVSLGDNMGVEGHFFLGSGSVEGVPTFTWYQKTGPNDYVRRNVNANESTIHYITDGKDPYYVKWRNCSRHSWIGTWAINTVSGCRYESYDFYVPKGSIDRSYALDNK